MPMVPFSALPNAARVWVFASDAELSGAPADTLLAAVDRFLADWKAHGVPLRSARDWRDDHFLAVGVDVEEEQASGCSIDGLFRTLKELEREIGTRLVGGGRVFYRDGSRIDVASREEFAGRVATGAVTRETPVFDLGVTTAEAWRERFVRPSGEGWTSRLFPRE